MAHSMIRVVNFTATIAVFTFTMWSFLSLHCVNGAPISAPRQSRLKALQNKIGCTNYLAILAGPLSSPSVLTVNSLQHTVALRNLTTHPVTLENLFLKLDNGSNHYLKKFKSFAGQYLSIDNQGHLTMAKHKRHTFLVKQYSNTTVLCVSGKKENASFLVSPFSTVNPVMLQKRDCETNENFIRASVTNEELKNALMKEDSEYHFRIVSVTRPKTIAKKDLVSDELRSLCFDPTCNSDWFIP